MPTRRRFLSIVAAAMLPIEFTRAASKPTASTWRGTAMGAAASMTLVHPDRAKARELILLGTRVDAGEALRIGLVHRVASEGDVIQDALRWIEPITQGAPLAQRAALRALRAADRLDLDAGLEFELGCYETCLTSEDRLEALAAFAEKRRPSFKGK